MKATESSEELRTPTPKGRKVVLDSAEKNRNRIQV